jgi:hypothetical protein
MAGRILLDDGNRLLDSNGNPISGGLVRAYDAGTSTPASLYTTSALTTAHASPVEANGAGFVAQMWAAEDETLDLKVYAADDLAFATPLRQFLNVQPVSSVGARGFVSTRTSLANVNGAVIPAVYLTESGREGSFIWSSSNLSAMVTLDTQQGIYVPPTGGDGSTGAWVRQLPFPGFWHADWFGIPGDVPSGNGTTPCHNEMTAMVDLANVVKPSRIQFASEIYTFTAAIPEWDFQVELYGARGVQGTIINKRYNEASATRGIFAFNDHGFTIDKISFRATAGEGGSAISAITTAVSPANGRTYLIDVYASVGEYSPGNFGCNYSLYVSGMSNTDPDGPGYRGLFIRGGELFGGEIAAVHIEGAAHVLAAGVFWTSNNGAAATPVLSTDGSATVYNDDWQIQGVVGGPVNWNWFGDGNPGGVLGGRSQIVSPQIGTITVDTHSQTSCWNGPYVSGGYTNNSAEGFYRTADGTVVASGGNTTTGWRKWGSLRLEQWGVGTTSSGRVSSTWPVAFTSTAIKPRANVTGDVGAGKIGVAQVIVTSITDYTLVAGQADMAGAGAVTPLDASVSYSAIGV